jgi:TolA-binding protein
MSTPLVRTLLAGPLAAGCSVSPTWLPHPWRSEEVARPIDEAREAKASAGAPVGSRGEVPGDPAETLYRLGLRQADPASGIRDYRAARATFTELLSQYPHSRRDAEARAWQAATLTDLLVREDDARRALLRLQRSEEDKKRTRANLEWLRQNDLDLERRK